jgi:DNA polymerase III delta subunit
MILREDQLLPSLQKTLAPVYWIQSDDLFLRDQLEETLIQALLSKGFETVTRYQIGVDFSASRVPL